MSIQNISSQTLLERLKKDQSVLILDVRSEEKVKDYKITHQNITNIEVEKTHFINNEQNNLDVLSSLPKNSEIIVVCSTGNSAKKVAGKLSSQGYQTSVLEGGITSWRDYISALEN